MDSDLRRYIERELRDYHDNKENILNQIKEERYSIILGQSESDIAGIRSKNIQKPTEFKALQLTQLQPTKVLLASWRRIQAIERALNRMTDNQRQLVKIKYWTQPQTLTTAGIAIKMHADESSVRRWIRNIIALVAREMGLI